MRLSPLHVFAGVLLVFAAACGGDARDERLLSPQVPDVAFDAAATSASLEGPWVRTDKDDYLPGDTVTITGGGWLPGETVVMILVEDPELHEDRVFTAQVDETGFFVSREFILEDHHFGVSFTLTAAGQTSGRTAVTTFTDGRIITRVELGPSTFCQDDSCTPATKIMVAPGATINAVVTVTTNNDTGTGNDDWRNTGWEIFTTVTGTLTCSTVPEPNVTSAGTHVRTVPVTAPMIPGTYSARFVAYQADCGSGQASLALILTDAIQVVAANTAPEVDAGPDDSIDEGDTFTSGGSFTDPDADVWSATVNYGDGGGVEMLALEADRTFDLSHQYLDDGTYTVTVCVMDDKGGADCDDALVQVANVAPTVDVGADETLPGMTLNRTGSFTDPGADTWTATVDYGDGTTGALQLNMDRTFDLDHTYASSGVYTVEVCVTDDDGGEGCDSAEITVENTPPVVSAGDDATLDEGDTFAQGGSFTDPDADTWTATVDYGDGDGEQVLALVDKTFSLSHVYTDDTGGPFTVTVCVSDGIDEACDTVLVTVNNIAPAVTVGGTPSLDEGGTFTGNGSFTDPGADMWTATVDYGDGAGPQALSLNPDKTFALSHVYTNDGSFTVEVCVTDDDTGKGCATTNVTVANVAPVVDAGENAMVDEGSAFVRNGSFTDPGDDPWTATVDYDDGAGVIPLALSGKTFQLDHTYTDDGAHSVEVCVSDDDTTSCDTVVVTVQNVAPVVDAGTGGTIDEGDTFTGSGSFTDPGADTWTATVDYGDGSGSQGLALEADRTFALSHTYGDNGMFSVTVCVTDDDGGNDCDTATVTVDNVAPTITGLTPEDGAIFPISSPVAFTGAFDDPSDADTHTCTTLAVASGIADVHGSTGNTADNTCVSSLSFIEAGVYTVTYTVTDDDGGSDSATRMIVVYDPSAGFVTGGGWIHSPAGAYVPQPALTGRANFGFVSKYQKGASVPTGNTEFQFHAGGLNFHSSSYQWLVVNQGGTNAQYKGTGRLNGVAGYGFMLWATDGGKSGPDTFRMKIWIGDDENNVVYDNGIMQEIGSGSIVIHTGGKK